MPSGPQARGSAAAWPAIKATGTSGGKVELELSSKEGFEGTRTTGEGVQLAMTGLNAAGEVLGMATDLKAGCTAPAGMVLAEIPVPPAGCTPGATVARQIESIAPDAGPSTGGTTVKLTVTPFHPGPNTLQEASVTFGGQRATVSSEPGTESAGVITVLAPPGTGTAQVVWNGRTACGTVSSFPAATFQYAPTVAEISPTTGSSKGGTAVTITGTGFKEVTAVRFGSKSASFAVDSEGTIAAVAPPGHGIVDVTVTSPIGTSPTNPADQFGYTVAQQIAKLTSNEVLPFSGDGDFSSNTSMSADGNTALVSSPSDNHHAGAAWIFVHEGARWSQQGPKLTGEGDVGEGQFGESSSLSGDGNTALIGGPLDDSEAGAAWVYTRSGSTWSQQGPKLVPGGEGGGDTMLGESVALSGDGNTALIAGNRTAWVFTRSGSTWSKSATLPDSAPFFGDAIALSADGRTAIIGTGRGGGAIVYTRSGSAWTEQAPVIGPGPDRWTESVALSADGNTALIGAVGTIWVLTRSGTAWSQEATLTGSDFGASVALSAEGNVALLGGPSHQGNIGAAWLFTRSGSTWTQQGAQLTGEGELGWGLFGYGVAMSADGGTLLVGGPGDGGFGAAWTFANLLPTVEKVQPSSGVGVGGATAVTITGTNLKQASAVKFGATNATSFEVLSETEIRAFAPAGSGVVDVTVTTPFGTSPTSPADQFAYIATETASFKNWVLSGTLGDKRLGQPITLPSGSTFNGAGEVNAETGVGSVKGNLLVPPFTTNFKLFGSVGVKLGMTLTQTGAIEGSLTKSKTFPGDETLTIPVKLNMGITSIGIVGLTIPTKCTTSKPIAGSLVDTLTREELLQTGWHFSGMATLPPLQCAGGSLGELFGVILTSVLSGPENPFSLSISA